MSRLDKEATARAIAHRLRHSAVTVVIGFERTSVAEFAALRRALDPSRVQVVKNTVATRAAHAVGASGITAWFEGSTALAFVGEDLVRVVRDRVRATKGLTVRGAWIDEVPLTVDEVDMVADSGGREALLTRFAGLMAAPATRAVRVVAALRDEREGDHGQGDGGGSAVLVR